MENWKFASNPKTRNVTMMNFCIVHIRSEDGRGPLWWAYEQGNMKIVNLLLSSGVDGTLKDSTGAMAKEMRQN